MRKASPRVLIRPTVRGWQVLVFGTFSYIVAQLIGTTQLYQLAYAFTGLLLVAFVLGFVRFRGLEYARQIPAGERFIAERLSHVELVVSNASRTRSPGMEVLDHLPKRRLFTRPPVERLGKQATWEPVLFTRRGLYEFGPAEIRATDSFGLLSFVRRFEARTQVLVYPEVFDLKGFPVRGQSMEAGTYNSFVRQGDEFSDLREYRHGDDRRHIHWKSVARTGELIVKEFSHNAPRRYTVVLDLHLRTGIHVPEVEVEDAISAAGSVLRHLVRKGLPFRLLCTDKERHAVAFGDDEAACWQAMGLLATARADGNVDMGDFITQKLRDDREEIGDGIILIPRSLDEGFVQGVQKLRAARLSVIVVALATHTYRTGGTSSNGHETAFSKAVRRLGGAGAEVYVVHRPVGTTPFAGERRLGAMDTRETV